MLLHSVTFEGRFTTPARPSTRKNRIIQIPTESIPSLNLAKRLLDETKEATHLNVTDWLQANIQRETEPTAIKPYKVLQAPGLEDDYYLNLLDWGKHTNCIAVGLQRVVYCWDAVSEDCREIASLLGDDSVASVAWMPGGSLLAVGSKQGRVELFDATTGDSLRRFSGHCKYRTGVLSWNSSTGLLSSGGRDKTILHHDQRSRDPVGVSQAHVQEVCGLKWDPTGSYLASGGNDNKVMVWDKRNLAGPIMTYEKHVAAVKALAWSPHVSGLLASGGGTADRTIRFWNTRSTSSYDPIKTIQASSQVCAMTWSPLANDLISTHGFSEHQVMRWSYPALQNTAIMMGHQQRVLHLCVSPDGRTVVTGSPDETLRFWKVFEERRPRNSRVSCSPFD